MKNETIATLPPTQPKSAWTAPTLVLLSVSTDTLNMTLAGDDGGGGATDNS